MKTPNVAGTYDSIFDMPLGQDTLNSLFANLGFSGIGDGYQGLGDLNWSDTLGTDESGNPMFSGELTPEALQAIDGFKFDWAPSGKRNEGMLTAFNPQGTEVGRFKQTDASTAQRALEAGALAAAGFGGAGLLGLGPLAGLGAGLGAGTTAASSTGAAAPLSAVPGEIAASLASYSPTLPSAAMTPSIQGLGGGLNSILMGGLKSGTLNAGVNAALGGDPGKGFLSGFVGGTLGGLNPAGSLGIDNPYMSKAVNSAVSSTAGALAGGQDFPDALNAGLHGGVMGGLQQGLSSLGSSLSGLMDNIFGNQQTPTSLGMSPDPAQNASYPGGMSSKDSLYAAMTDGGMRQATPQVAMQNASYPAGQTPLSIAYVGNTQPQRQIQSLGDLFKDFNMQNLGKFAGNNLGTLLPLAYGLYNYNEQKRQLNRMMGGLNSLYNPNGAYATQLRGKLEARDAAAGRRSNYEGRETQLMANLADRTASMAPTMFQMQQGKDMLNNRMFMNTLASFDKLGGFKLGNLFGGG